MKFWLVEVWDCSFLLLLFRLWFSHFFRLFSQFQIPVELHHPILQTMSNHIPVVTQDEDPTMAPSLLPAKKNPGVQASSPTSSVNKKKSAVQLTLFGFPMIETTKTVSVSTFRKKNGTVVPAHTRHVKVAKVKSTKKSGTTKSGKPTSRKTPSKFIAPNDCKESVALAFSLHIEEHKKLTDSFCKKP